MSYKSDVGWFVIERTRKVSEETISLDKVMAGRISLTS